MSCTQNGMQGWKKRRRNSSASKKGEVEEGGKWSSSFFFFNTHTHKKKKKTSDPCQPCSLALPAYALDSLSVRSSAMAIPWLFLAPFCHRQKKGGKEEKKKKQGKEWLKRERHPCAAPWKGHRCSNTTVDKGPNAHFSPFFNYLTCTVALFLLFFFLRLLLTQETAEAAAGEKSSRVGNKDTEGRGD